MAYFRCGGGGHSDAEYNNLMDQLIEETATGPIASFTDGANNIPTKEIICHINPTETGTGEKSPQNPYVIGGFTETKITQTDGQTPLIISKLYTVPFGQTVYGGELQIAESEFDKINPIITEVVDLGTLNWVFYTYGSISGGYTRGVETRIKIPNVNTLPNAICEGLTPHTEYRFDSSPDYNFAVNPTGLVKVHCSGVTNAAELKAALNGINLFYEYKTPKDPIILPTKTKIKTLLGANNFYHDCNGNIDVTYRANGALYVQEHPITRGLMATRPPEQIQEQEEQQEEKEINKSEDNEK